jgi:glutamate N-acetyltransferase/amino-acid N-acetyltransferase
VPAERLDRHLRQAVEQTFNRITVDGCTSTSDACLLLAGGRSGVVVDAGRRCGLRRVARGRLRRAGPGGRPRRRGRAAIGRWSVTGARSDADARAAAFAVAEDQLVRCALHGADPNWGRIVAALGRVDVDVDFDRLAIDVGDVELVRGGVAVDGAAAEAAGRAAAADEVPFHIDLGRGRGTALVLGSDLSPAYVRANSEYTT